MSQWVPLRDALQLALHGEPISPEPDNEDNHRAEPGLLRGLIHQRQWEKRKEFDIALSKAALEGEVQFEGCRSPDAPPEPIPPTYFIDERGFQFDGSILPWPHDPLAYRRREPIQAGVTWTQGAVDRDEFFKWLVRTYPSTVALVGAAAEASQILRPRISHLECEKAEKVTARKSLGKQPALIEWLREKSNGTEVPEPSLAPRKQLIAEAIKEVPSLGGKLDEETMKKAIDAYNISIRGDPNNPNPK